MTYNELLWATIDLFTVFNTILTSAQGNVMLDDYQASYESLKISVTHSNLLAILNFFFDFVALGDLSFTGYLG